ncbi:MAG TPA: CaiB/BaiF CoA-transferase family protein [Thermoanaerobaculia bacterium]|nr:CaiB/BaiF CoA-transferase family protein [Thermoanaerobaculia bacterium]
MTDPSQPPRPRPLDGIRVLEMGQLLAGPFAATLLAYFGAEVIKIEPPRTGDPIRGWRGLDESGTSLWWRSVGRNKRCITLDLHSEEGRALTRRLAAKVDVLIENFKPGTLERWGLGPEELQRDNPELILARVSGYGQTGPSSHLPGYASVCEGVGGLRHVTGHPGEPPVRANLSLGDSLAGLHTALGVLLALFDRLRRRPSRGQVVDVAIYEAVFNMMEAVVPEYDRLGQIRGPSGTTITGVVPTNTYPTRDGRFVIIGGTGESIFRRLMAALERPDLGEDPRLATNAGRVEHQEELDRVIAAWTAARSAQEVLAAMAAADVPAGPIHDVADMVRDPHFQARGLFERVDTETGPLTLPAILPKLTDTPGRTEWAGPNLSAHTREVLSGLLGLSEAELDGLQARGVIG